MTRPASRTTDPFECSTHILQGPTIIHGDSETKTTELPATRVGDMCLCPGAGGHTTPVASGAAIILIDGAPAARIDDTTLDGGLISMGADSVLIGDASVSLPPNLAIEGTEEYRAKVARQLGVILGTKSGQKLFDSMSASDRSVVIRHITGRPRTVDLDGENLRLQSGTPRDVAIEFDPDMFDYIHEKEAFNRPPKVQSDALLFHELVHADGATRGERYENPAPRMHTDTCPNPGRGHYIWCGENRATGLPPYDDHERYPSENSYREEQGYAQRPWY